MRFFVGISHGISPVEHLFDVITSNDLTGLGDTFCLDTQAPLSVITYGDATVEYRPGSSRPFARALLPPCHVEHRGAVYLFRSSLQFGAMILLPGVMLDRSGIQVYVVP